MSADRILAVIALIDRAEGLLGRLSHAERAALVEDNFDWIADLQEASELVIRVYL